MNDSLPSTLGHLHAQIYWLHDAEKFAELASAAAQVYKHLGYDSKTAKIVGGLISEAYQLSDPADLAYKAGDFDLELQFYHQAKDKLVQVETHLGLPQSIAEHQIKWWMYFRHKQKLLVICHLFLQHFKSLGWVNLIPAIQVTYYLIQAGKIHKLRNVEMTSQYTTHYWQILLKIQPQQYPYLG